MASTGTIDVNALRREFQNALSTLLLNESTFILGMVVKSVRVVADPNVETIAVENDRVLRINPDYFLAKTPQERVFLLAHEAMHVLRLDATRFRNYARIRLGKIIEEVSIVEPMEAREIMDIVMDAWNILADAKINDELKEMNLKMPSGGATCREIETRTRGFITEEECREKSVEEILDKLLSEAKKFIDVANTPLQNQDIMPSNEGEQEQQGSEEQQQGSEEQKQQQEQGEQSQGQSQEQQGDRENQGQQNQQSGLSLTGGQCSRRNQGTQGGQGKKQSGRGGGSQRQQGANQQQEGGGEGEDDVKKQQGAKDKGSGKGRGKGEQKEGVGEQKKGGSQKSGESGNEVVLNEGDEELQKANEKELRNKIVQIIYTASIVKGIGNMPGWARRLVDELTKERIDWRRVLAKYLRGAILVRRKLTKENRKNPDLVGKEVLGKARVVVLVDTSGSIGEEELRQFISEVRAMTPYSEKIVVIPFDTQPYGEYVVRTKEDVKRIELTGGGGTMIGSTLELVDRKYGNKVDAIVILSDWWIGDLDDEKVTKLLRKYSRKIIAVTTEAEPPKYLPYRLKIELSNKE